MTSRDDKLQLLYLLKEKERRRRYNIYKLYQPYEKQKEFHKKGLNFNERCLGAGNQLGKTLAGSMEAMYHATGMYPDWWVGVRFEKENIGWVAGVTNDVVRDTTQKLLVGRIAKGEEYLGTGAIPRDMILGIQKAMGTPNLLDHVKVRHISGGISIVYFKSYAQGYAKFQGETIDWVWLDEEPPADIYSEALTRTNNGQRGQTMFMTFTPLQGMTEIVRQFYENPHKQQTLTVMTIYDVGHYTEEEKESIVASYPSHIRKARAEGIPVLGSGMVYPINDELISEPHIDSIPDHWKRINGLDFGWDHPTSAISLAWDVDNDVIHVVRAHRQNEVTPVQFAEPIKKWGNIVTSWPHDGFQHDKGSGKTIASQYKDAGVNMLHSNATHPDGGNGVEAGLLDILTRMEDGRFKVDETLRDWFEEKRMYHRKAGKIVKLYDDLMDATRYAVMMLRYAEPVLKQAVKIKSQKQWRG